MAFGWAWYLCLLYLQFWDTLAINGQSKWMRWLIALVLTLALQSTSKDLCSVREFYSIAWGIHDPTERHRQMAEWLIKHQQLCKSTDFIVIWNNMAEWAGNSDSHQLRALVIHAYKEALEREKK